MFTFLCSFDTPAISGFNPACVYRVCTMPLTYPLKLIYNWTCSRTSTVSSSLLTPPVPLVLCREHAQPPSPSSRKHRAEESPSHGGKVDIHGVNPHCPFGWSYNEKIVLRTLHPVSITMIQFSNPVARARLNFKIVQVVRL